MRAMAVDFGFKKIGLAIGETEFNLIRPRAPLTATGTLAKDARAIADLAKKEEVEVVVIGLPVEESGVEGRMARICRTLGGHIGQTGLKVAYVDESYTSLEAAGRLVESKRESERNELSAGSRKKGTPIGDEIHGEAAVLILERFLG